MNSFNVLPRFPRLETLAVLILLSSCGGGGGDGGTSAPPPPPPPPQTVVSGSVEAPNGQVAREWPLYGPQKWLATVLPAAVASVPGASPVPNGTPVELLRLNPDGSVSATLANGTTSGGRYSFNFTELDLDFTGDLLVTAIGGAGVELRTFVTGTVADIDVESETAVQLVLDELASGSGAILGNYTMQEQADLVASVRLVAMASGVTAGIDVPSTVDAIRAAILAEADLVALLEAAKSAGQTNVGPGDIGNFFPFDNGYAWTFDGSVTIDGTTETYKTTLLIDGTRDVNGTTTTIFAGIDPGDSSGRIETLLVKNKRGLNDWTAVESGGEVLQIARFPLTPGATRTQNAIDLSLGEDLDGDGIIEIIEADAVSTMVGFEDVVVPGGSFQDAARIASELTFSGTLSAGGETFSGTIVLDSWYAPGVGQVRSDLVLSLTADGQSATGTVTEELTGGGFLVANNVRSNDLLRGVPVAGDDYRVVTCDDRASPIGYYSTRVPGSGRITGRTYIGAPMGRPECGFDNSAAAWDGANYLVAFAESDNTGNTNIVAVRMTPDGTLLDTPEIVLSTGSSNFLPAVAFDGTDFLVVWQKFDPTFVNPPQVMNGHEIYGARVSRDGSSLGEFAIFTSPGEQSFPSVAFDGTNFLVAWADTRSGSGPSDDTDIYGVRVSPAGSVLDDPPIAIVTAPGAQGEPQVASSGGNWLVVWNDVGQLGSSPPPNGRIFGKRIAPDGSRLDGSAVAEGIAIATAPVANYGAAVAYVGNEYRVVWAVGSYPVFGPAGIHGMRVSTNGQLVGGSANTLGPSISGTPPDNYRYDRPQIASRGSDALVTWASIGNEPDILGAIIVP